MRTLWRTTTHLFWQYPILWLPAFLADLTAYCLRSFQAWMTHAVINNLVAGHSVLSNTPEPLNTVPVAWSIVFATSRLVVELLNFSFYAIAMIALSILIPALIAQAKTRWQKILFAVKQLRVQILLFSMKIFGMLLIAAFLDTELMMYLPRLHVLPMSSTFGDMRDQNIALIALLFAAIAWLIAPSAVALLRPPESPPNDTNSLRHARTFAAVSVVATVALYQLATIARPSFTPLLTTPFSAHIFWAIASAISAIPYIPLFIALYLIANPNTRVADSAEAEPVERMEPTL